jgi:hypothetical protein
VVFDRQQIRAIVAYVAALPTAASTGLQARLRGHRVEAARLGSACRFGRSRQWLKVKNPAAPAVRREAEEEWR